MAKVLLNLHANANVSFWIALNSNLHMEAASRCLSCLQGQKDSSKNSLEVQSHQQTLRQAICSHKGVF